MLDLPSRGTNAAQAEAAATRVDHHGRVVPMGGFGRFRDRLPLVDALEATLRGAWMPDAVTRKGAIVRSGLIELGGFKATEFVVAEVDVAVAHAAERAGPAD